MVANTGYTLSKKDGTMMKSSATDAIHGKIAESHWKNMQLRIEKFVTSKTIRKLTILMIVVNSLMMGIGTSDFVHEDDLLKRLFQEIDFFFLLFFTAEILLQLVSHGLNFFDDWWLVFDLSVIMMSWAFSLVTVTIIRAFEITRALRLIARVDGLKEFTEALLNDLPRIGAIGVILLLIFYIFAVMCTQLFKDISYDGYLSRDYFARLDKTFFTLFQMMTLDNWTTVSTEVMDVHPWAWVIFVPFVIISAFTVVNLVVAVICEAVGKVQRESMERELNKITESICEDRKEMEGIREDIKNLSNRVEYIITRLEEKQ